MPKRARSLKRAQSQAAIAARWSEKRVCHAKEEFSHGDFGGEINPKMFENIGKTFSNENDFLGKLDLPMIGDLFDICKNEWGSRKLTTLLYMILRYLGHQWRIIDDIFRRIGANRCETAHKWAETFLSGDFEVFMNDGRGGKNTDSFYDIFPELEIEAKCFVADACARKSADFTVSNLAKFIDEKYYDISQTTKVNDALIRSETSCRLDLRRWGAKFDRNNQRPYFEGHERPDVVDHREQFISYFLERKDNYYTIDDSDMATWQTPTQKPCILIFHDESTFQSGDVSYKRCLIDEETSFFCKGKGRSHMISDFLICHPSGPFFSLSESEFQEASKVYPNLLTDTGIKYIGYSATAGINLGYDVYFDNETILNQFERLFQLLPFKAEYKEHDFEIIVDNARTHSAKEFSLNDFSKGIGTRCRGDSIEFIDDDGKNQRLPCFFSSGENKGKSKGLLVLAKELKLDVDNNIKLDDLQRLLSNHSAFKIISRLQKLAAKHQMKIIFNPKYHCELNSIEGLWCSMKRYIRQKSDQTFPTMLQLIPESKEYFLEKNLQKKLFRRFWRTLNAYSKGKTYSEVLQLFFSGSCKYDIASHRKITNSNLDH
ncbi:unnamed protein product [Rotaria sp. Silwood2]|nr:unnamed protein product [Rotaria sp. Silwood2]CAF2722192.1 unnamed protein product [Rotaria sp. Silwood2]CAF3169011.1 unnamed protein product [Rotaria sp. Silwood2]CAF3957517.1 unnamed protein product [Rotaria sp. Silwood2]CAF4219175.1 unnamed protein product [Rotaria sp. Silwood2]